MRKKLIVLGLTLAAVAATSSASSRSARTCPAGTYPIACEHNRIICCPDNAFCVC